MKKLIFIIILMAMVYSQRREADRYFATNITITNNTVNLEMPKGRVGSIYDVLIVNESTTSGDDINIKWNKNDNDTWILRSNRTLGITGVAFSKVFISNSSGTNVNILFLIIGH